ncbi:PTS N-acetylglucosamine transporter subunit IIBC [Nocardia yunnanensis]|uniref:PTS N-acetylglucosamine transporter subunit IIBC n=1 Tax=Nocardia yunnanensis TaxID=2382165 RepID=A0A386ZA67_9NOCA|nr:PTS transporter subunit EIIC [Nocardia yunnanensis]AYF74520.1 PTS N-acetylglucosamine transporter subunit IIBC [Nocardia yunnanensis]
MADAVESSRKKLDLSGLQKLGRSLMLPIATLPAAGLLLRLGQDDMLGRFSPLKSVAAVLAGAGGTLIDNLPLLFAVGIAIGWAKKADGSTALAAVVGYLAFSGVLKAMSPVVLDGSCGPALGWIFRAAHWNCPVVDTTKAAANQLVNFGVLGGIVMGLTAATLWQRYHRTQLPEYLGFFSGRRLVPILTACAAVVIGVLMSFIYPAFNSALTSLGNFVADNSVVGGGIFGFANRMLLPLGLHHIINSVVWFVLGDYTTGGQTYHGDIAMFLHGDPHAGTFMTGFFPIMMFGLPAAALAIWRHAKPENRKMIGGIMLSTGLTAFLTGITEPLEFSFIFVAWPLLLIHAIFTGSSLALTNALGIHDGFTFSAGAIDYLLNFGKATHPLLLIPVGLGYAALYYVTFSFIIKRWNLKTPGREDDEAETEKENVAA